MHIFDLLFIALMFLCNANNVQFVPDQTHELIRVYILIRLVRDI